MRSPSGKHLGWKAVGFSPSQLRAAEAGHTAGAFNADAWMNGAKPESTRPYSTPSSARQCAAMLEQAGWKRVTVIEDIKK